MVVLSGRLTRDAFNALTQKGQAYSKFDIAVNRRYMDAGGNWQDEVAFVPVSLWGPAAERAKDRLKKGVPVLVEGRLVLNEYTGKDGTPQKQLVVNTRRVQILQSMYDGAQSAPADNGSQTNNNDGEPAVDDDVPF
jgi:single-strand DNA-binding protein